MKIVMHQGGRWISWVTFSFILLAAVLAIQDYSGAFWKQKKHLKPSRFRVQDQGFFRYLPTPQEQWVPLRLGKRVKIFENKIPLNRVPLNKIRQVASGGESGQFAVTPKSLWITPFSGKTDKIVAVLPMLVPWWCRLFFYGAAGFFLLLFSCSGEPVFWVKRLLRFYRENVSVAGLIILHSLAKMTIPSKQSSWKTNSLLLFLAVMLTASASGLARPIWIDEFLHYCLAGYQSTAEAWKVISETVVGINHGQTGVYMLVDYWLLKMFGASAFALRLPSLVSAFLLMLFGAAFMRLRGFGFFWQLVVMLAIFAQDRWLMYFAAEARPYMPLAAATLGILTYYLAPLENPKPKWIVVLGWGSVLLGSLIHPYFAIYWLAMFGFAHLVFLWEKKLFFSLRSFFHHVNLPMSLTGSVAFLAIGCLSWLRGGPHFTFDPFYWIKSELVWPYIIDSHMEFLSSHSIRMALLFLIGGVPLLAFVPSKSFQRWVRPLLAPAFLFLLAFALTALVSYLSYRRNYWILQRQWIASIALVPVAFIWFTAELTCRLTTVKIWAGVCVMATVSFLIAIPVTRAVSANWHETIESKRKNAELLLVKDIQNKDILSQLTPEEWVTLANLNVRQGEDVWPCFHAYYDKITNR